MIAEIWMGSRPAYIYEVKNIERSIDGSFIKITTVQGKVLETSPTNVILIHDKEKGGDE